MKAVMFLWKLRKKLHSIDVPIPFWTSSLCPPKVSHSDKDRSVSQTVGVVSVSSAIVANSCAEVVGELRGVRRYN